MKGNKVKKLVKKYVTTSNVQMAILFVPLLYLLIRQINAGGWSLEDFLDTSILTSFLLALFCEVIATAVSKWVGRKYEDSSKLTEDYKWLVEKYPREKLFEFQGKKFPIILLAFRERKEGPFEIRLDESRRTVKYELPSLVKNASDWIMKAHEYSVIYNNMNIRADDIRQERNEVTIAYSRTTYFDSMVTNRAMDYVLENGKTIREIYEPGPFLNNLQESKFSNHIGFNGFIETKDGKIIFVVRGFNLSIGKNTLANSIGASLKVQYCLDDEKRLTIEGLSNGIRNEIKDELKIKISVDERFEKSIFAFYRDIVEGGKPQFLFYYKLNDMTAAEFKENFRREIKKQKRDKKTGMIDGSKFLLLTQQELRECQVTPGELILANGRKYKMMPSAAASVGMLLNWFGEN